VSTAQSRIQQLPPTDRQELRHWMLEEESPRLQAEIKEGIRRIDAVASSKTAGLSETEYRRALKRSSPAVRKQRKSGRVDWKGFFAKHPPAM